MSQGAFDFDVTCVHGCQGASLAPVASPRAVGLQVDHAEKADEEATR